MPATLAAVMAWMVTAFQAIPQDLTEKTFEKWHTHVIPTKEELTWLRIPWRPVFWDAVVEAQKKDMPLLLWVMNGHPLACT